MERNSEPGKILAPIFENMPKELIRVPAWVVWRAEWDAEKGKYSKIPIDAKNGRAGSSTNIATWSTYGAAKNCYEKHPGDFGGVGFVLSKNDPFVGIDCDHVITDDGLDVDVVRIVDSIASYAELSPSGTGIRIFAQATLPLYGRKRGDVELYDSGRFLTVTGHRLDVAWHEVRFAPGEVAELHRSIFPPPPSPSDKPKRGTGVINSTDVDIITLAVRAKNASNISALYDGNWIAYANGKSSGRSEADMALASHLAFYTGPDHVTLDRLMRSSGLMRDKWDEVHYATGETYGEVVCHRAIALCKTFYSGARVTSNGEFWRHVQERRHAIPPISRALQESPYEKFAPPKEIRKMKIYDANDLDVLIVADMLSGNLKYWDAMLYDLERGNIGEERFPDRRLRSLVETLLMWRKKTIGGNLENWQPKFEDNFISGNALRSAAHDFLLTMGMVGDYESGDDCELFHGWTLAELEALAANAPSERKGGE